jgi:hypothetical protein
MQVYNQKKGRRHNLVLFRFFVRSSHDIKAVSDYVTEHSSLDVALRTMLSDENN